MEAKLENVKALLEKNLTQSTEALRQILGLVTLQAVYLDIGKPYYVAHSSIDTITLLENSLSNTGAEYSSTKLRGGRGRNVFEPCLYCNLKLLY